MRFYAEAQTFPVFLSIDELKEMYKSGKYPEFTKYYMSYLEENKGKYKFIQTRRWIASVMATKVPKTSDTSVREEVEDAMQILLDTFGMDINKHSPEELSELLKNMVSLSNIRYIRTKGAEELLILRDRETGRNYDGIKLSLPEIQGTQFGE